MSLSVAGAALALPRSAAGQAARDSTICAIQGPGAASPFAGQRVVVRGVVTADLTATSMAGFFLQDPACDNDTATSDGIFVDASRRRVPPGEGRRVSVTGRVRESFGLTQIEAEEVADTGAFGGVLEAVPALPPSDPAAAAPYLEAREGMVVALPPSRVVGATNAFGEAFLMPESSGVTRLFRRSTDGRKLGIVSPTAWLGLDHGDRVTSAIGPLTYTFGEFKVVVGPGRASREPSGLTAPEARPAGPDELTIASYNLENLFDPVDDPDKDDRDSTPTPQQYAVELARRARSIARLLGSPDLLGVQEVEKLAVLEDLAAQPELAGARYRAVLIEGIDGRGIDVGLLYKEDRARLRSAEARQACTDLPAAGDPSVPCALPGGRTGRLLFTRPPLLARLTILPTGEGLTVIVNHFKSKSGDESVNARVRLAMADHVRALVVELRAQEPDSPVVVLGDLNDFEDSAPLLRLTQAGLVDPHRQVRPQEQYTYLFSGVSQILDYILVDPALASRLAEFGPRHINVDFAHLPPGSTEVGQRTSDHDPPLLRLRLGPAPGLRPAR